MKSDEVKNEETNPDSTDGISLKEVAYHEAGHAVIAYLNKLPINKVSIIPTEDTLGRMEGKPTYSQKFDFKTRTFKYVPSSPFEFSDNKIMKEIMMLFAGDIAENILTNREGIDLSTPDHQIAIDYAEVICASTDEMNAFLNYLWYKTYNTLTIETTWLLVETLAAALLEKNEISGRHVKEILKAKEEEYMSSRMKYVQVIVT